MFESKKRILVLHGWNAAPSEIWFPKVKEYFETKGYEVYIPYLPGNYFPNYQGWLDVIKKFNPDENTILIGHSLGGTAIMRYLEKAEKPVAQIILTATPIESMGFNQISCFFGTSFDWKKIKQNAPKINLIYEEDDPIVPLDHCRRLAKCLEAPIEIIPGGLHLPMVDMKMLEKMIDSPRLKP